jgi:hypothetical protein
MSENNHKQIEDITDVIQAKQTTKFNVDDDITVKNIRDMLRNVKLDNEEDRWYIIYVITNKVNGKNYVGQAVSHLKKKEKYKPYGAEGRLIAHFREADSNKVHQCTYLNNAIRLYGKENFTVQSLVECEKTKIDELEINYIKEFNSMFPNGYNIMRGGRKIDGLLEKGSVPRKSPSLQYKLERIEKARNDYINKQMQACLDRWSTEFSLLDFEEHLKKATDKNGREHWMLSFIEKSQKIKELKLAFVGKHITLDESYKKCKEFYIEFVKNLARRLVAGNS